MIVHFQSFFSINFIKNRLIFEKFEIHLWIILIVFKNDCTFVLFFNVKKFAIFLILFFNVWILFSTKCCIFKILIVFWNKNNFLKTNRRWVYSIREKKWFFKKVNCSSKKCIFRKYYFDNTLKKRIIKKIVLKQEQFFKIIDFFKNWFQCFAHKLRHNKKHCYRFLLHSNWLQLIKFRNNKRKKLFFLNELLL